MTSTETIRSALADLWDTGANAYELAQAVMQAADLENGDIEFEVESVIARALLARELVDLSKVAAEVAKVLPGGMRLELEIGKTYKNREGDKVKIVGRQPHPVLPFRGDDDCTYCEYGGFRDDALASGFDLVEECEPDVVEEPKPEALPLMERILEELAEMKIPGPMTVQGHWHNDALDEASKAIRKHFAALTVEEVARVIEGEIQVTYPDSAKKAAQAIMRLLRGE